MYKILKDNLCHEYEYYFPHVIFLLEILATEIRIMTKLDAQKNKEDKQRNLGSKRFHKYLPLQIANSSNEVEQQKSDPPTNHHWFW